MFKINKKTLHIRSTSQHKPWIAGRCDAAARAWYAAADYDISQADNTQATHTVGLQVSAFFSLQHCNKNAGSDNINPTTPLFMQQPFIQMTVIKHLSICSSNWLSMKVELELSEAFVLRCKIFKNVLPSQSVWSLVS